VAKSSLCGVIRCRVFVILIRVSSHVNDLWHALRICLHSAVVVLGYVMLGVEQCCLIADDVEEATSFTHHVPSKKRRPSADPDIPSENLDIQDKFQEMPQVFNVSQLEGHIILCGKVFGVASFLKPLRNITRQPVLVMHPEPPADEEEAAMSAFDLVYYFKGSPLESKDLERARAHKAAVVIILCDSSGYFIENGQGRSVDTFAIFVANVVEKFFPSTRWVVELTDGHSMHFLSHRAHPNDPHPVWPRYASGNVYLANFFDSLLAQSYYNQALLGIISKLIHATDEVAEPPGSMQAVLAMMSQSPELPGLTVAHLTLQRAIQEGGCCQYSSFRSVEVPETYYGKEYVRLFKDLILNHNFLALGLYRPYAQNRMEDHLVNDQGGGPDEDELDNELQYVLTNPIQSTTLKKGDAVYVLSPATTTA